MTMIIHSVGEIDGLAYMTSIMVLSNMLEDLSGYHHRFTKLIEPLTDVPAFRNIGTKLHHNIDKRDSQSNSLIKTPVAISHILISDAILKIKFCNEIRPRAWLLIGSLKVQSKKNI